MFPLALLAAFALPVFQPAGDGQQKDIAVRATDNGTWELLVRPGEVELSFAKVPPGHRPTKKGVLAWLPDRAVGMMAMTLRGGSESYLTGWHPNLVIDLDWATD